MLNLKEESKKANWKFFNGELDIDKLTFKISKKMTTTRGKFTWTYKNEVTITISDLIMESDVEAYKTLIHELVHYYQWTNEMKIDHGEGFRYLASKINAIDPSLEINRTNNCQDQFVANRIKEKRMNLIKNQYMIKSGNHNNFMKNLKTPEIESLKASGHRVFVVKNPNMKIRNHKNMSSYQRRNYFYRDSIIDRLGLELKEI